MVDFSKKILLCPLLGLFSPYVFALGSGCELGDTTTIYFVNGVWNTVSQATDGRKLLIEAYKSNLHRLYPDQKFEFKVAYNYHAGKVRDVIEVIGQKLNEMTNENKYTAFQYLNFYLTAKDFNKVAPFPVNMLGKVIEEYFAARMSDVINTKHHIQKYQADLMEGKRVLLVAHSQGNMFANQALTNLIGEYQFNIGMIGIASPAALQVNSSPYFTAGDDRIINALRYLHTVLPANINNKSANSKDGRDFSNHQFKDSYFNPGLASRTEIDKTIIYFMEMLQFPIPDANSGAITVTLTWGSEPDVDLHVFEPNGSHVFYRNKRGITGHLDVDDITGYGPEHFYVSCQNLEVGNYAIGVNYFKGSEPETAHVQISTADGNTRSFSRPLAESLGSSGDNSPMHVATINVAQNENSSYQFTVY